MAHAPRASPRRDAATTAAAALNILRVIIKDESAKLLLLPPSLLYCAWPMPDPRLFAAPRAGNGRADQCSWGEIQNYYTQLRPDVRSNSNFIPEKKTAFGQEDQAARSLNAGQSSESFQRESGKALL
jgi:hypothetical protein